MDTPLHTFARCHDGVVTVRSAARLGYDWSRFRAVVRTEGWVRIAPSAYAMPDAPVGVRARVRAEQLRHVALVASHRTAAVLHGGDVLVPGFEFTVAGTGRYDVPDGTCYRWLLDRGEVTYVDGLRVTTPVKTATDLLRGLRRDEAVVAVDALLRRGAVALDEIAAALESVAGRRYARRAWRSFARLDPRAESVTESLARLRLWDAGLRPRSQVVLVDVAGRRVRVDFWFPNGVVVEVEGYAFHGSREQHQADVARFNELARIPGVTVLRFSWADVVHRPAAMVASVRAALATGESRRAASENW